MRWGKKVHNKLGRIFLKEWSRNHASTALHRFRQTQEIIVATISDRFSLSSPRKTQISWNVVFYILLFRLNSYRLLYMCKSIALSPNIPSWGGMDM
jgi:hypothetical protein